MKVAVIYQGKRLGRVEVPWLTEEILDEVIKDKWKGNPDGYEKEWKKVGNEYRLCIRKIKDSQESS